MNVGLDNQAKSLLDPHRIAVNLGELQNAFGERPPGTPGVGVFHAQDDGRFGDHQADSAKLAFRQRSLAFQVGPRRGGRWQREHPEMQTAPRENIDHRNHVPFTLATCSRKNSNACFSWSPPVFCTITASLAIFRLDLRQRQEIGARRQDRSLDDGVLGAIEAEEIAHASRDAPPRPRC